MITTKACREWAIAPTDVFEQIEGHSYLRKFINMW